MPRERQISRRRRRARFFAGLASLAIAASAPAQVTISVTGGARPEGDAGEALMAFAVTLSAAPEVPVSVAYETLDCTALAGEDYTAAAGRLWFHPGGPTTRVLEIEVLGDDQPEGTEHFNLQLSDPTDAVLGSARAAGIIDNDDLPLPWPQPRGDVNGDGRTDLVVSYEKLPAKNDPTPSGKVIVWYVDGTEASQGPVSGGYSPSIWTVAATTDLADDGVPDLVWRHHDGGLAVTAWSHPPSEHDALLILPPGASAAAELVGGGRFTGAADPELVVWDAAGERLELWLLDGEAIAGVDAPEPALAAPGWRPLATGDFDADGWPDVLWIEDATGELDAWLMEKTLRQTVAEVRPAASAGRQLVAVGDFDGDGDDDLLWQDTASGELVESFLDGTTAVCEELLVPHTLAVTGWSSWQVEGPR